MTIQSYSKLALGALVALALALTGVALSAADASACSCAKEPIAQYIAEADTVFLGKVGKASGARGKRQRTYKVLLPVKGNAGTQVKLREVVGGMCSPMRKTGEVVVVFVKKGVTGLCAGNFSQETQLEGVMRELLVHLGGKQGAIALPTLKAAIASMMKGYMHKRAVIEVVFPALMGKTFKVAKTVFKVVAKSKSGPAVKVTSGVTALGYAHVGFIFDDEGIVGNALLNTRGKSGSPSSVIAQSVYEN